MKLRVLYEDDIEECFDICYFYYIIDEKKLVYILTNTEDWTEHISKDIKVIQIDNYVDLEAEEEQ